MRRWYSPIWIDKASLGVTVVVLAVFLVLWLLLVSAAGSAPTGRLSMFCLSWMARTEAELIIPTWLVVRCTYGIASGLARTFRSRKPRPVDVTWSACPALPGARID
jgi:hypothetical protein